MLQTSTEDMRDWLMTGRAYVRAQLVAAQHGLYFHPVSQALQEFQAMTPLRSELAELLDERPPGEVQMLVRVGRTEAPAVSPRRPLNAMLIT